MTASLIVLLIPFSSSFIPVPAAYDIPSKKEFVMYAYEEGCQQKSRQLYVEDEINKLGNIYSDVYFAYGASTNINNEQLDENVGLTYIGIRCAVAQPPFDSSPFALTVVEQPQVTFNISPSFAIGSITFSGSTYSNGQSGGYASGDYSATANPLSSDYSFHHWEYSGSSGSGVYVPNISANPTTVQVRGTGWLKAVFSVKITFHTNPAGVGSISYGSSNYSNGQSTWEVNLSPEYGNTVTIRANPSSGYVFHSWSTTGSISVSSTSNNPATATINGAGSITANFEPVMPPVGDYIISITATNIVATGYQGTVTATYTILSVPTAPQNLQTTPRDSRITLGWNQPSSDGGSFLTSYKVYRGTGSREESLLATPRKRVGLH